MANIKSFENMPFITEDGTKFEPIKYVKLYMFNHDTEHPILENMVLYLANLNGINKWFYYVYFVDCYVEVDINKVKNDIKSMEEILFKLQHLVDMTIFNKD